MKRTHVRLKEALFAADFEFDRVDMGRQCSLKFQGNKGAVKEDQL
jgi:hypothetical protein